MAKYQYLMIGTDGSESLCPTTKAARGARALLPAQVVGCCLRCPIGATAGQITAARAAWDRRTWGQRMDSGFKWVNLG